MYMFEVIDLKTNKPPNTYDIALKESWADGLIYCDMEGFLIQEDGSLCLADECGNYRYCPHDRFKLIFHFNNNTYEEIY